mmetsp:Transcript_106063/g.174189  ORF Transcript_106063/g.174189 Transcript_106063/m.174189 type:complete len:153 (+) Transcript_106063:1-459(+)
MKSFVVLISVLDLPTNFGRRATMECKLHQSLQNGFSKRLKQEMKLRARANDDHAEFANLHVLQIFMLSILDEVLHQQLNHKSALLLSAREKHMRTDKMWHSDPILKPFRPHEKKSDRRHRPMELAEKLYDARQERLQARFKKDRRNTAWGPK